VKETVGTVGPMCLGVVQFGTSPGPRCFFVETARCGVVT
jgi:hypothetical protein